MRLTRILRFKPHTLGEKEEKLLAMQTEMARAASHIFRQLNDADLKFGTVRDEKGQPVELSHGSYIGAALLARTATSARPLFTPTICNTRPTATRWPQRLDGSIQRDIYYARARNYASSLEAALFPDQVPAAVYDNLIASVRRPAPRVAPLLRRAAAEDGAGDIHHYDTYVPILAELRPRHSFGTRRSKWCWPPWRRWAASTARVLASGLASRWCDRYENRGKQSGAFSAGSYDGDPYILMNYQPDVLDHVFTLAHEAGHSMHSYFSAREQPYAYYDHSHVRGRGGQHVQRDAAGPLPPAAGPRQAPAGVPA